MVKSLVGALFVCIVPVVSLAGQLHFAALSFKGDLTSKEVAKLLSGCAFESLTPKTPGPGGATVIATFSCDATKEVAETQSARNDKTHAKWRFVGNVLHAEMQAERPEMKSCSPVWSVWEGKGKISPKRPTILHCDFSQIAGETWVFAAQYIP